MGFLRVVEVFPPFFPLGSRVSEGINIREKTELLLEAARSIRGLADVILVADVKNPKLLKLSTIETARILKEHLRVEAAPVIVLRGANRQKFLSEVLTGITSGLGWMMIAWGDDYPGKGPANVRDFSSLSSAIREASSLRARTRTSTRFFAPVNVDRLASRKGMSLAKKRLRAGAEYLLAQPPTSDAEETFERHLSLLEGAGLKSRVLLNVFPFWDAKDVTACEKYFGWKLPRTLHRTADRGNAPLLESERAVIRRIREEGLPGVYVNSRGVPGTAERLLS